MLVTSIAAVGLQLATAAQPPVHNTSQDVDVEAAIEATDAITPPQGTEQATETPPQVEFEQDTVTSPLVIIPRDTPVHLMVINEVSTKDHDVGHTFVLRVDKPVTVAGEVVIPVGAKAWGELTEASSSGNAGKSGKLSATLTHIEFEGRNIPIEGVTSATGKSGKAETIMGVIALGPLGLFAKGNNAKIKAGERMTAFIAEDVTLSDAQ